MTVTLEDRLLRRVQHPNYCEVNQLRMFPIIPQTYTSRSTPLHGQSYSTDLLIDVCGTKESEIEAEPIMKKIGKSSSGVIASKDIPPGTSTQEISIAHIMKRDQGEDFKDQTVITVSLHKDGCLREDLNKDSFKWFQRIMLADVCHSYNVQLERSVDSQSLRLVVTQPLKKGEKLIMWFSEEILTILMMPFLTPVNIQGEKNYRCHLCRKTFEYPNPLKMHLLLGCFSHGFGLWMKLHDALKTVSQKPDEMSKISTNHLGSSSTFKFSLISSSTSTNISKPVKDRAMRRSIKKTVDMKSTSPSLTSTSNPSPNHCSKELHEEERPSSEPLRFSAFKPYLNLSNVNLNDPSSQHKWYVPPAYPPFPSNDVFISHEFPLFPPQPESLVTRSSLPSLPNMADIKESSELLIQQAVDMETLVSNLGRSKQGHLCIYCGKVYSRKYGLKIHIRTHTGFKPLKCKYCSRPFGDPSNLNKHVRLHAEGETPYKCEQCGKILVRRRDLERHMKSRHQLDCDELEDLRISQDESSK